MTKKFVHETPGNEFYQPKAGPKTFLADLLITNKLQVSPHLNI